MHNSSTEVDNSVHRQSPKPNCRIGRPWSELYQLYCFVVVPSIRNELNGVCRIPLNLYQDMELTRHLQDGQSSVALDVLWRPSGGHGGVLSSNAIDVAKEGLYTVPRH